MAIYILNLLKINQGLDVCEKPNTRCFQSKKLLGFPGFFGLQNCGEIPTQKYFRAKLITCFAPCVPYDFRSVCISTAGGYFRHFPCMLLMNDCIIYGYLTTGLLFTVTIHLVHSILLCTTECMFGSYNHKSFSWIAFNPGHLIVLRQ